MSSKKPTKTEIKTLDSLLTQAIKLTNSNKTRKHLKRAQTALKKKEMEKVQTEIIKAFESLPKSVQMLLGELSPAQQQSLEQMISGLYRRPQTNQKQNQSKIDRLLNQSYQTLQTGRSGASYVYLLGALDRAQVPLEKTPRQFQKQLQQLTKRVSAEENHSDQIGGAVPVPFLVGGVGLITIILIYLLIRWRRRRAVTEFEQELSPRYEPSVYGSQPSTGYSLLPTKRYDVVPGYEKVPEITGYGQLPSQYGVPPALAYGVVSGYGGIPSYGAPPKTVGYYGKLPVKPADPYGQLPLKMPRYGPMPTGQTSIPAESGYGRMPTGQF